MMFDLLDKINKNFLLEDLNQKFRINLFDKIDLNNLSNIIDDYFYLGIESGELIAQSFEKKIKHVNFLYGTGIDFIGSFFKLDNKLNNYLSDPIFKIFRKKSLFWI